MTTENARQTIPPTVTPCHFPYGVAGVVGMIKHPRAAARCQARLLRRFAKLDSWGKVAAEAGIDKGLCRRVALGLQVAPPAVRGKLYPETPRQRERVTLAERDELRGEVDDLWTLLSRVFATMPGGLRDLDFDVTMMANMTPEFATALRNVAIRIIRGKVSP